MLLMGKSTISMAMFNSYVKLPEGIFYVAGLPFKKNVDAILDAILPEISK